MIDNEFVPEGFIPHLKTLARLKSWLDDNQKPLTLELLDALPGLRNTAQARSVLRSSPGVCPDARSKF